MPMAASPDQTTVSNTTDTITDASGGLWKINSAGNVTYDGAIVTGTKGVTQLAYAAGVVWQLAPAGWYSIVRSGTTFTSGVGPTQTSPLNAAAVITHPTPDPTPLPTPVGTSMTFLWPQTLSFTFIYGNGTYIFSNGTMTQK